MAPRIRAERNSSAKSKEAARAKADAHFAPKKGKTAKAEEAKAGGAELKSIVMDLGLAEKRDYLHHLKTLQGLNKKKDEVVALIRNARSRAKESNVDPRHLDFAIRWADADPVEFNKFLAGQMRAAEVAGIKTPQISFLDESGLSPVEKAQQDGHRAGTAGMSHTANPHDPNSDSGRAWEEFRQRGQTELAAKGIGAGAEVQTSTKPASEQDRFFDDEDEVPNPAKAAASIPSPAADAAHAAGIAAH